MDLKRSVIAVAFAGFAMTGISAVQSSPSPASSSREGPY